MTVPVLAPCDAWTPSQRWQLVPQSYGLRLLTGLGAGDEACLALVATETDPGLWSVALQPSPCSTPASQQEEQEEGTWKLLSLTTGTGTGIEAEAQVLYHIQSGLCLSRQAPSGGDVVLGLDECGAEGTTVDIRA